MRDWNAESPDAGSADTSAPAAPLTPHGTCGRDPCVDAGANDHRNRATGDPRPSRSDRTLPFLAEPTGGRSMDEIKGIARVKFHAGKLDEWKRLTEQAMEIVRTRDTGTLQYEVFFNDDESEAIVFERYQDADAALEHFANMATSWNRLWPQPPSPARSSAPRTRRCEHSSATTNRNSSPRG